MYPFILNLLSIIYITVSALLSVLHARTKAIGEYIVTCFKPTTYEGIINIPCFV